MHKKKYLSVILSFIFLIAIIFFLYCINHMSGTNLNISIQNDSNSTLEELSLYCNDTKLNTIFQLEPKKYVNLQLDFPSEFIEGKVTLEYKEKGTQKETIIWGYIENNSHKKANLTYAIDNKFIIK